MVYIQKDKAINLRLKGFTYSDINKYLKLNISKSTFSKWFKDLKLSDKASNILRRNIENKLSIARQKALITNRNKRKNTFKYLKNKNLYLMKEIDLNTKKLLLSILYLSEGSKYKRTSCMMLGNSDARIIKLYMFLLETCFDINYSKYRIRIQCRAGQDIDSIEKYWLNVTKIDQRQFYPTYIDKRTIGKKTKMLNYKGVCVVHYFDRSVQIELELLADSVIEYLTKGR